MKVITDFSSPQGAGESIVALGCFDGLHRGHQAVLDCTVEQGREEGLIPSAFTFASGAEGFKAVPWLETDRRRLGGMERLGIAQVFFAQPGQVRELSPEAFVKQLLAGVCRARRVVCGANFRFGKDRQGDARLLDCLCAEQGIKTVVVPELLAGDSPISSTRIRALLQEGDIEEANALLGRPFGFCLPVVAGRQRGREIGIPTINQPLPDGLVQPCFGVYISQVDLQGGSYYGLTNIGVKPTVGSDCVLAETWMPDFQGDLYGQEIPVSLLYFLRREERFTSLPALRGQIGRDQLAAEQWLRTQPLPPMENLPLFL